MGPGEFPPVSPSRRLQQFFAGRQCVNLRFASRHSHVVRLLDEQLPCLLHAQQYARICGHGRGPSTSLDRRPRLLGRGFSVLSSPWDDGGGRVFLLLIGFSRASSRKLVGSVGAPPDRSASAVARSARANKLESVRPLSHTFDARWLSRMPPNDNGVGIELVGRRRRSTPRKTHPLYTVPSRDTPEVAQSAWCTESVGVVCVCVCVCV